MKLIRWFGTLLGLATATATSTVQATPPKNEHALVVHFAYGSKDLTKLFALEEELEKAILAAGDVDAVEKPISSSISGQEMAQV
jgi:hypothetical protein